MPDTTALPNPTDLLDASNPEDAKALSTEMAMRDSGTDPFKPAVQAVYFGFDETKQAMLPDGISYLSHRVLTEGRRRDYLKRLDRTVRVQNVTRDALMKTPYGEERKALLQVAVIGWNLIGEDGNSIPFNDRNLEKFIDGASPMIIDHVHDQIAEANPWLQNDVSVEDIDKEIETLNELREKKIEEEEGKDISKR